MLEAFHPRDQLECMLSAQAASMHGAIMECLRRAMHADTKEVVAIKLRANAAQLSRCFSGVMRDLERRQGKSLPPRPEMPEPGPQTPPPAEQPEQEPPVGNDDASLPEDAVTRPDGTPGSLGYYMTKEPEQEFVPGEPPIMLALATRPKPWRIVGQSPEDKPEEAPAALAPDEARGPLDLAGRTFNGDDLARFASARHGPKLSPEPLEDEESLVELEIISTGGDPEAEAERAALAAAHPEGRAVKILRHGAKRRRTEE
jgi:hypothetical protein